MKAALLLGFLWIATSLYAQPGFQIDGVSPAKRHLYLDGAWNDAADCIEARLSVTANTPSKDLVLKIYFFGIDGKLLETVDKPSPQTEGDGNSVKMPPQFERGRKYSVYFGVPASINSGSGKWKRAVVVFGKSGDFANKIYPKDDIAKFDFSEKSKAPAK